MHYLRTLPRQVYEEDIGVFVLLVPSALATAMSADGSSYARATTALQSHAANTQFMLVAPANRPGTISKIMELSGAELSVQAPRR